MTGVADLYLYLKKPYSKDRRKRFLAHFARHGQQDATRFVVLSWKRTGSNLLCGILHHHNEIIMHNELFNPIDIFTYHPHLLLSHRQRRQQQPQASGAGSPEATAATQATAGWTVMTRDLFPGDFLDFIWSGKIANSEALIRPDARAIGFKSFPEHWTSVRNDQYFQQQLLEDFRVKKIILFRKDELAVFVSMKRSELTGSYLTHAYPENLKITIDPAEFQTFVNNYRHTYQNKYRSPVAKRDTFWINYEDLVEEKEFESKILPELWKFLGVDSTRPLKMLKETVKQADPNEDVSLVIKNYDELEFCFRHSDILHFAKKREDNLSCSISVAPTVSPPPPTQKPAEIFCSNTLESWSVLLPICSRPRTSQMKPVHNQESSGVAKTFNKSRFLDLALSSQHDPSQSVDAEVCWTLLSEFATSLQETASTEQLELTECVVGIDIDDTVFQNDLARERIRQLLPCKARFVKIQPDLYGHICKIWNLLARECKHDFIVLMGDDVRLLDAAWQQTIVSAFRKISRENNLPYGAACVAMNDLTFPGFPTFPVVHRWHVQHFGSLLPKQFANQGGDPYLYELYSRFNAADFEVGCRLLNTIGGDDDARYQKHHINWRGHILSMNLRRMKGILNQAKPKGVCLDIVVPSYRVSNNDFLRRIALLRASVNVYVKFWFVADNPQTSHVEEVKQLASELNEQQLKKSSNYFINVIHYGENRGASYARNTGFNYSTADWILFLDDDIIPDENILDAYVGAVTRYPDAKVFVGMTELPDACNFWTELLCVCNVGYFYSIAKRMVHPSWGVTANLMVRGSRHNSTIQFKSIYPKTGGGEDIDFVYQFKEWYQTLGRRVTVGVPEAKVKHPWWKGGRQCYSQIIGWAVGDSLCITEWGTKTFLACPNWIEHVMFIIPPLSLYTGSWVSGAISGLCVTLFEHTLKTYHYFTDAKRLGAEGGLLRSLCVAFGAGSILSSQEVTRAVCLARRGSLYSLCRRVDWFDGEEPRIKLDIQLQSIVRFGMNCGFTLAAFQAWGANTTKTSTARFSFFGCNWG